MEAPVLIFTVPVKHGDRSLNYGDRFDQHDLGLSDEIARAFTLAGTVKPLTRETYANAMQRREPDAVGAGFTAEWLLEQGIIDAERAAAAQPFKEDAVEILGYWVTPVRRGNITNYEVRNPAQELMREKPFAKPEGALKFIQTLPPVEPRHDSDLSPESLDGG